MTVSVKDEDSVRSRERTRIEDAKVFASCCNVRVSAFRSERYTSQDCIAELTSFIVFFISRDKCRLRCSSSSRRILENGSYDTAIIANELYRLNEALFVKAFTSAAQIRINKMSQLRSD